MRRKWWQRREDYLRKGKLFTPKLNTTTLGQTNASHCRVLHHVHITQTYNSFRVNSLGQFPGQSMQRWTVKQWIQACRYLRCYAQSTEDKAFSKTLLLPKTSFPLRSDPAKSELPFRKKTTEDLYLWQVRCTTLASPIHVSKLIYIERKYSWTSLRPARWSAVCKWEPDRKSVV